MNLKFALEAREDRFAKLFQLVESVLYQTSELRSMYKDCARKYKIYQEKRNHGFS